LTTRALHWDRGRLARSERAARTDVWSWAHGEIFAPFGAHCGRAARGPSEQLEWSSV